MNINQMAGEIRKHGLRWGTTATLTVVIGLTIGGVVWNSEFPSRGAGTSLVVLGFLIGYGIAVLTLSDKKGWRWSIAHLLFFLTLLLGLVSYCVAGYSVYSIRNVSTVGFEFKWISVETAVAIGTPLLLIAIWALKTFLSAELMEAGYVWRLTWKGPRAVRTEHTC